MQSGLDYVFSFFERGHCRQTGRFDREVRRPEVFSAIAAAHRILPSPECTILITGSKGKGSCARLVASYLRQQAKKVGLVLTPEERHHLDRIRVDGIPIPDHAFLRILDTFRPDLEATADSVSDTYYHPPTAIFLLIALKYFHEQDVDYIVIEGGRGARYDEIGQLQAAVGIVTSVLPEHMNKLGPTVRDICADKFSLAGHCKTLVCSNQAWQQAIVLNMAVQGEKVCIADAPACAINDRPVWMNDADAMARAALQALGLQAGAFPCDENVFASCQIVKASNSPVLQQGEIVFLDGAIAADCLDFDYIGSVNCAPKAVIFGMSADKDAQAVTKAFVDRGYEKQFFFKAVSKLNHMKSLPFISQWQGEFDTEAGLDETSRRALLELIHEHQRVYIVGVQIFLRSVRNILS